MTSSPRSSTDGRGERDDVVVTTLRPDDTVLLIAKEPMSMEMADRIREQWRSLPQKVLVLDSSFKVIVRPAEPDPFPPRFHLFGAPQRRRQ